MTAVFVFALTLLLAVLVSDLADRTILSTAVLFLLAGFTAGEGMLGIVRLTPEAPAVAVLAELALFSVLFTDGMRVGLKDLASAWRLPGRALLFGLPLTLLGTAMVARWVAGLTWAESFLVGAVLSPTDPVFAAAIVGRQEVPARLRQLLNVESGLNDGLALPIVLAMLAVVGSRAVQLVGGGAGGRRGDRRRHPRSAGGHRAGAHPVLFGPRLVPAAQRVRDRAFGPLDRVAGPRQRVPRRVRRGDHGGDRRAFGARVVPSVRGTGRRAA